MAFMKKEVYFLIFFSLFIIQGKTVYEGIDTWSPELLYEYAKKNYLSSNNIENISNIKYMLVDPENYLKNKDLSSINQKMELLYDKFNISIFIILISHLQLNKDKKSTLSSEIERFTSYFNYMIYKEDQFYNDNFALTTSFFIKDRKMRMRTGRRVKEVITDDEALNLLRRRKNDLREENYYDVVDNLLDDIYQILEDELIYHKNYFQKNKNKIIALILFLLFVICVFYLERIIRFIENIFCEKKYTPRVYENPHKAKINQFLNKNKNKKIKTIFNESCIICLEEFRLDKEQSKYEKTTVLECGHKYHDNCITEWLKKYENCPICRSNVKFFKIQDNNLGQKNGLNQNLIETRNIDEVHFENDGSIERQEFFRFLWNIQENDCFIETNKRSIDINKINFDLTHYSNNRSSRSSHSNHSRSFGSFDNDAGGASSDW